MSQPLYKIANQYLGAYNALYGNKDIPEEAINDTLEGIEGEIKEKVINIAAMIKNIDADSEKIKQAERLMSERRKGLEAKSIKLREYILQNLSAISLDKVFTPEFDIKIQSCPPSVEIDASAVVPNEYLRIVPEKKEPDKIKLKEALEQGLELKGVCLIKRKKLVIN